MKERLIFTMKTLGKTLGDDDIYVRSPNCPNKDICEWRTKCIHNKGIKDKTYVLCDYKVPGNGKS